MSSQQQPSPQHPGLSSSFVSSDAPLPSSPTPAKKFIPAEPESISTMNTEVDKNTPPVRNAANPRLAALATKRASLEAKLADLQAQRLRYINNATLPSGLAIPAEWTEDQRAKQALATANGVLKEHITLLHAYNEIKDIGLGLMGLVADQRGVRQKVIMEEFGMGDKD